MLWEFDPPPLRKTRHNGVVLISCFKGVDAANDRRRLKTDHIHKVEKG